MTAPDKVASGASITFQRPFQLLAKSASSIVGECAWLRFSP